METKDAAIYDEYCKYRNKVRSITRSIRRTYEKRIVLNTRTTTFLEICKFKVEMQKHLYSSLDHRSVTDTDEQKVEVLSKMFASVYTDISDDSIIGHEPVGLIGTI